MGRDTHAAFTWENTMFFAVWNKLRIREQEKMGREAQGLHLPVKTPCFVHLGISCELGNRKKWDGRQTGGIYLWKANVLRSLEWDQQYAHWGFHNRVWRPKDLKTSESETLDGQNIQTLQHALCWTPAPPNLNVSARVLAKVMLGVWLFSSIGANALQVTITLNFEGEGVVPHRRGLNISSIYGRGHRKCPSRFALPKVPTDQTHFFQQWPCCPWASIPGRIGQNICYMWSMWSA